MTPQRFKKLKAVLRRRQLDLTVLMDNVHKPHNLSAIIRSCDAVGVHNVHAVTSMSGIKPHKDVASGAGKWVNVHRYRELDSAMAQLRRQNMQILAAHLSQQAMDFREVDYTRPTAILLGTELYGVSEQGQSASDQYIVIPMLGMIDSLNVSVAAALILFEAQRQRQDAGLYDKPQIGSPEFENTLFEWSHPKLAKFYADKGLAYPPLDEQGNVLEQDVHRQARLNQ